MTRFVVAGTGTVHRAPEQAVVSLGISVEGTEHQAVLREAAAAHEAVSAHAAQLERSGAAERWSAQSVRIEPYQWHRGEGRGPETRYRATAGVQVTVTDFEPLDEWVTAAAAIPGATVQGVAWQLREATYEQALGEARVLAVHDAFTRAATFATAAGAAAPVLEAIYEAGLRPGGGEPAPLARGFDAASPLRAAAAAAGPSFVLHPAEIVVQAAISADFAA